MKKIPSVATSIRFLSAVLSFSLLACGETPSESIATVGDVEITREELHYRGALQAAQGGDTLPPHTALVAAVNDALALEVAEGLGLAPTDEEVRGFLARATFPADVLQRIVGVFGEDSAAFFRVYLKPNVVQSKLQQYQAFDTGAQNDARKRIELAYSLIAEGKNFTEAAAQVGGTASVDTFAVRNGGGTGESGGLGGETQPLAVLAEQHLQPGVVFPQAVENEGAYRILRLIDRNNERSIVEMVSIPKMTYDVWLRNRADGIPILLHDKDLADSVRGRHGMIWWVGRMEVK